MCFIVIMFKFWGWQNTKTTLPHKHYTQAPHSEISHTCVLREGSNKQQCPMVKILQHACHMLFLSTLLEIESRRFTSCDYSIFSNSTLRMHESSLSQSKFSQNFLGSIFEDPPPPLKVCTFTDHTHQYLQYCNTRIASLQVVN